VAEARVEGPRATVLDGRGMPRPMAVERVRVPIAAFGAPTRFMPFRVDAVRDEQPVMALERVEREKVMAVRLAVVSVEPVRVLAVRVEAETSCVPRRGAMVFRTMVEVAVAWFWRVREEPYAAVVVRIGVERDWRVREEAWRIGAVREEAETFPRAAEVVVAEERSVDPVWRLAAVRALEIRRELMAKEAVRVEAVIVVAVRAAETALVVSALSASSSVTSARARCTRCRRCSTRATRTRSRPSLRTSTASSR
jgi:hypothetical protein